MYHLLKMIQIQINKRMTEQITLNITQTLFSDSDSDGRSVLIGDGCSIKESCILLAQMKPWYQLPSMEKNTPYAALANTAKTCYIILRYCLQILSS